MKKGLRITRKFINILLTITIVIVLPIVTFTLISSKTDKLVGIQSFVVLSGSMEPNVPTGSVIYTKPELYYAIGNVVAFIKDGRTITHRIVNMDSTGDFITKGDANNIADNDSVPRSNIIGKEVFTLPYLGYIIRFLGTVQGFILLIVAPVLIFVALEFWNMKKEMERAIEAKIWKKLFVAER